MTVLPRLARAFAGGGLGFVLSVNATDTGDRDPQDAQSNTGPDPRAICGWPCARC